MFKKVIVGLALVAIGCAVAGSGYRFGQYLAERENVSKAATGSSAESATRKPG